MEKLVSKKTVKSISKVVRSGLIAFSSAIVLAICSFIEPLGFRDVTKETKNGKEEVRGTGFTPLTFIVTFIVIFVVSMIVSAIVAAVNKLAFEKLFNSKSSETAI